MKQNTIFKIAIILQCFLIFGSSFTFAFSVSCAIGAAYGQTFGFIWGGIKGESASKVSNRWSESLGGSMNDW